MWLKKHIPNIITLLGLFCGCIAVIFAVYNKLELAALFVFFGIGFDFFDGFAARILHAQSALGLQLDSLADMIISGLAPGIVMVQLLAQVDGNSLDIILSSFDQNSISTNISHIPLMGLLITLASAYRLAKFNIDTRQTTSFIGLPTPANTLVIISLPLILIYQKEVWITSMIYSHWFLIGLTILSCYMLNAKIPLFGLKFKTFGFAENKIRYVFLLAAIILIIILKFIAIPCVILLYVLISVGYKTPDASA